MSKYRAPIEWNKISIDIDGTQVTGTYSVDKSDFMTVRMDGGGTKQTHAGLAAEGTAKLMLSELFRERSIKK